jgi:hypothetical protein
MPKGGNLFMTERDRRREQIARCQHIADLSAWEEQLMHLVGSPMLWSAHQRTRQMRPFLPFFQRMLHPWSPFDRLRDLACNLQLAKRWGWPLSLFRHPSFGRVETRCPVLPADLVEPILAALFAEPAALSLWMQEVDAQTQAISRQFLERMDQTAREQREPLATEIVLVGGGPLTCLMACVLSPFFHVTVITDEAVLGASWRHRPLFLNSSANVSDDVAPALPLLGGPTTRLIDSLHLGNLEISLLLETKTKQVVCADRSRVDYPAGRRFGELVATNLVLNADRVLLHQHVEVAHLQRLTDGSLHLSLRDTRDGTHRCLRTGAVFLLTGPGQERSRLLDPTSQALYQQSQQQVSATFQTLRRRLAWYQDALLPLRASLHVPGVARQYAWVQQQIREACQVEWPPLLTLNLIEEGYAFWQQVCGGDPASFPFFSLFAPGRSFAVVGNGDTARTLKEWLDGAGPRSAYPADMLLTQSPTVTIYNEQATTAQAYAIANRRRYQDVWSSSTRAVAQKARLYRHCATRTGASRIEVTHLDETGKWHRYRYQTVFDATGLAPASLADQFPAALGELHLIRDLTGQIVARGNEASHVYFVGAAANLNFEDLPQDLQRIVEILRIKENRLALWLNGGLAERLAVSYLLTHTPTKPTSWLTGKRHGTQEPGLRVPILMSDASRSLLVLDRGASKTTGSSVV